MCGSNEAVEHHRQVTFHIVHQIEEVLFGRPRGDDPIELLPHNQRALANGQERLKQVLRAGRGAFEKMPAMICT